MKGMKGINKIMILSHKEKKLGIFEASSQERSHKCIDLKLKKGKNGGGVGCGIIIGQVFYG